MKQKLSVITFFFIVGAFLFVCTSSAIPPMPSSSYDGTGVNITATTANITTLTAATANITGLTSANNVAITGGSALNLTTLGAATAEFDTLIVTGTATMGGVDYNEWTNVTAINVTPITNATILMTQDMTATILKGYPLHYIIGGGNYFGLVSNITANVLTVAGAPLSGNITQLQYNSDQGKLTQLNLILPGYYDATATNTAISDYAHTKLFWQKSLTQLVQYCLRSETADTGTNGIVSISAQNNEVVSGGLTIAANDTLYCTTLVDPTYYAINRGDLIDAIITPGANADGAYLTMYLLFVTY